jgi:hypothetical protein
MYLISNQVMSEKLAKSWMFLGGVNVTFSPSTKPVSWDGSHTHRVVLPVTFENQEPAKAIAISLIIDDTEAKRVASNMFGVNPEDVTEDDIKDACRECCNVLGGGLVMDASSKIGIPYEISSEEFEKMKQNSTLNLTFSSDLPYADLIVLSILDINNKFWSMV